MKAQNENPNLAKIFISFPFDETGLATHIAQQLKKSCENEVSIFPQNVDCLRHWKQQISDEIMSSGIFIFIIGEKEIGDGQFEELAEAVMNKKKIWKIETDRNNNWNNIKAKLKSIYNLNEVNETPFIILAKEEDGTYKKLDLDAIILLMIQTQGIKNKYEEYYNDGLPIDSQVFNYEKKIIDFYYDHNNFILCNIGDEHGLTNIRKNIMSGVPAKWPIVRKRETRLGLTPKDLPNEVEKIIGKFRNDTDYVLSAALSDYHKPGRCPCNIVQDKIESRLIFPEAGPRKTVSSFRPEGKDPKIKKNLFRVGVLVSGGIAPGINALIDGITRRHYFYAEQLGYSKYLEVCGLENSFYALESNGLQYKRLFPTEESRVAADSIITSKITNEGGSIIGTSRYLPFVDINFRERIEALKKNVVRLRDEGIRILYIIGGEGSMKAAMAIQKRADQFVKDHNIRDWDLTVVGIPKTMDNDILWVWQTFGFMSAVEKAREFIEYLYVESKSNPRWGIVQLFGSNSGFVVSHAVLACKSDICDLALIPEMKYKLHEVVKYVSDTGKDNGLIVLAETAVPSDIGKYMANEKIKEILTKAEKDAIDHHEEILDKIDCHVNDNLRSGVVKIIAWALEHEAGKKIFINEPRHLLRSIPPSTIDIITASRLGTLAVDNAMAGYYGFMISQWLTEFCLIPLELVVLGRKQIPPEGIFFKSVIDKTKQPQDLLGINAD